MEYNNTRIGAYFYPQTRSCQRRQWRASSLDKALNLSSKTIIPDEYRLAAEARPLFEGHDQPRRYQLGRYDSIDTWDDTTDRAIAQQVMLAASYGLSYFILDTYHGIRDGQEITELGESNRITARAIQSLGRLGLKFQYARMETLEGPRALLPIPKNIVKNSSDWAFNEPGRSYNITPQTARYIVDRNVNEWRDPAYLQVDYPYSRPYLSILTPAFAGSITHENKVQSLKDFINELYEYAYHKYDVCLYIAGVLRQPSEAELWLPTGIDALTQYCALAEHGGHPAPDLQDYSQLTIDRQREWVDLGRIASRGHIPFAPSAAVGWDASPRGEPVASLSEATGLHPYMPIVTGATADIFEELLTNAVAYIHSHINESERLATIFAWNEVGESATLLHRLHDDGTVDGSYLEAVSRVVHQQNTHHDHQVCNECRAVA